MTASSAIILSGCGVGPGDAAEPPPRAPQTATPTPDVVDGLTGALAERDAFIEAQQLPLDGSPLVATTDAQKQFIAEQRAFVESQGAAWSAQSENLALALTADACETSILNAHSIDLVAFQTHVETSPLFAAVIPEEIVGDERTAAERNVASVMVFGTGFLCPADAEQWESAFTTAYPG